MGLPFLAVAARWGSPALRAALYGSASAVMWALVATFIKATTDTLTQFGVAGMFTRWPVYALAAGSVVALFLTQAALHVGIQGSARRQNRLRSAHLYPPIAFAKGRRRMLRRKYCSQ